MGDWVWVKTDSLDQAHFGSCRWHRNLTDFAQTTQRRPKRPLTQHLGHLQNTTNHFSSYTPTSIIEISGAAPSDHHKGRVFKDENFNTLTPYHETSEAAPSDHHKGRPFNYETLNTPHRNPGSCSQIISEIEPLQSREFQHPTMKPQKLLSRSVAKI